MRAASSRIAGFRLCGASNGVIQIHIPTLGNVHAACLHIAACRRLKPHGFELILHSAHSNKGQYKAGYDCYRYPAPFHRLLRHIAGIVGASVSCPCDKIVTKLREGIKSIGIIAVRQRLLYLAADVLNPRICECRDMAIKVYYLIHSYFGKAADGAISLMQYPSRELSGSQPPHNTCRQVRRDN